ncbi:MAG: hypothetical protein ACJAVM_000050 [Sulfitobacter sp.]|jgi:hypothetical protein
MFDACPARLHRLFPVATPARAKGAPLTILMTRSCAVSIPDTNNPLPAN